MSNFTGESTFSMDIYLIPSANTKQIWHPFCRPHHQSTSNLLVFSFVFDAEALVQDNVPQELIIFIQVRSRVEFFQRGLGKQHCFVTSLQTAKNRFFYFFLMVCMCVRLCSTTLSITRLNRLKMPSGDVGKQSIIITMSFWNAVCKPKLTDGH